MSTYDILYVYICHYIYMTTVKQKLRFKHKDLNKVCELMRDVFMQYLTDFRRQMKTKTERSL